MYVLIMETKLANKENRALNAIRKINKIRHGQAKQIDILCNDMVSAHRDFIEQLNTLTFAVNFYESICGKNDLIMLLNSSADQIKDVVPDSNVSIFLTNPNTKGFKLHMTDDDPIEVDSDRLESFFDEEVVNSVSRSNKICSLNDMTNMGLQGNPLVFSKTSAAAIPFGRFTESLGFILIWRPIEQKLTPGEIEKVVS